MLQLQDIKCNPHGKLKKKKKKLFYNVHKRNEKGIKIFHYKKKNQLNTERENNKKEGMTKLQGLYRKQRAR